MSDKSNKYIDDSLDFITIKEKPKKGLDPIPNGDVLLVPLNLIPTPISGSSSGRTSGFEPGKDSSNLSPLANAGSSSGRMLDSESSYEGSIPSPAAKGLTPDQKRLHWEAYAKKTERQEEVFKKVFNDVFMHQSDYMSNYYSKHGELPVLNDEDTAKRFEAAIELVYHDAFESAV